MEGTQPTKIVAIREATVPIASAIRNAYIDFSKMTASIVAVITDVVRDGRPVVGFGFNSNGRYAQSALLRYQEALSARPRARPNAARDASVPNLLEPAAGQDYMKVPFAGAESFLRSWQPALPFGRPLA